MYRQRHGQAAANQNGGIEGAQEDIEMLAPRYKPRRIGGAIHRIPHEQPTKEHDLGQEKGPHPEAGGLMLLCQVVKLMGQRGRTLSQHGFPPGYHRHRLLASLPAFPQSSRSAVAKVSAT